MEKIHAIFKGGFYTVHNGEKHGVIGAVSIICPTCSTCHSSNVTCYTKTPLSLRCSCSAGILRFQIDSDSIELYGRRITDKEMKSYEVLAFWRRIEALGDTGITEFNKNKIEQLGLYGYYFDNRGQNKRPNSGSIWDRGDLFLPDGNMWFAGMAFSQCTTCKGWNGKEVIQQVGAQRKEKCVNHLCTDRDSVVDYTITTSVFDKHRAFGDTGTHWMDYGKVLRNIERNLLFAPRIVATTGMQTRDLHLRQEPFLMRRLLQRGLSEKEINTGR